MKKSTDLSEKKKKRSIVYLIGCFFFMIFPVIFELVNELVEGTKVMNNWHMICLIIYSVILIANIVIDILIFSTKRFDIFKASMRKFLKTCYIFALILTFLFFISYLLLVIGKGISEETNELFLLCLIIIVAVILSVIYELRHLDIKILRCLVIADTGLVIICTIVYAICKSTWCLLGLLLPLLLNMTILFIFLISHYKHHFDKKNHIAFSIGLVFGIIALTFTIILELAKVTSLEYEFVVHVYTIINTIVVLIILFISLFLFYHLVRFPDIKKLTWINTVLTYELTTIIFGAISAVVVLLFNVIKEPLNEFSFEILVEFLVLIVDGIYDFTIAILIHNILEMYYEHYFDVKFEMHSSADQVEIKKEN